MTQIPLLIRPALESDFDALCVLFEELDAYHRELRPDLFRKPMGAAREFADVASLIAGPDSAVIVAVDGTSAEVLGLATLLIRRQAEQGVRRDRSFVEIDNLAVRESVRRKGVGAALVQASVTWAAERSYPGVELMVHASNESAVGFYRKLGFAATMHRMALNW